MEEQQQSADFREIENGVAARYVVDTLFHRGLINPTEKWVHSQGHPVVFHQQPFYPDVIREAARLENFMEYAEIDQWQNDHPIVAMRIVDGKPAGFIRKGDPDEPKT